MAPKERWFQELNGNLMQSQPLNFESQLMLHTRSFSTHSLVLLLGALRYLVDTRWLNRFHEYIGFDPASGAAGNPLPSEQNNSMDDDIQGPGKIDNRKLVLSEQIGTNLNEEQEFVRALAGGGCVLRRDITEVVDYTLLTEKQWELLSRWYGGGPAIPRR